MKSIAFDLGRVLFDFDYSLALNKIKKNVAVPAEKIINDLFYRDFALDFEKGLVSSHEFYIKFKESFLKDLSYEEFVDAWCDIFSPRQEVIDLVKLLRRLYPLFLISNINELHFEFLQKKHPNVFSLFDDLILSFKMKSVKPEFQIYEALKGVADKPFENIVYIDDRRDLIDEAKHLGLNCIQFTDVNNLITELDKHGIIICSPQELKNLENLERALTSHHKPLIVGIGNTLKGDDGVGVKILEAISGKITAQTLVVGAALENYLNIISEKDYDLIIFVDAAELKAGESFSVFSYHDLKNISLFFTHDSSLKLAIEYLQSKKTSDILMLGIKASSREFNSALSKKTERTKGIIENFFLRSFPLKH